MNKNLIDLGAAKQIIAKYIVLVNFDELVLLVAYSDFDLPIQNFQNLYCFYGMDMTQLMITIAHSCN